jgi:transcriptional regulator with XRE-family HTH domain
MVHTDSVGIFKMARKITQTSVAELLGVSPRVYTRLENGDAKIHNPELASAVQESRSAFRRGSEGARERAR